MARIPEEELERLKREVSVARLVEGRGIVLKKHGENLLGLCPFHDDREPSLVVTPRKNLWHCLGVCQAGGSVIDWVMRVEKCSFTAAVEMLQREHIPSLAAPSDERRGRTTSAKLAEIAGGNESDAELAARVVSHYQSTLKNSGEGLAYLGKRRIESHEAIAHFKLGFANRTLGYRIPVAQVKAGAATRGQLQRLGIYRESGHEHFNGCLTIPIFDAAGGLAQMYGRRVREGDLRPGTSKHLYLARPHTAVWNESALVSSKEVILCESLIDALTFWCAGLVNVITSYGVEGFTKAHLDALKAHGTQKVLIAYDRDDAGDRAAEKLAPELAGLGMGVFRVQFPRGMDANEYAQKMKPVGKSLETALRAAHWMAGTRGVLVPSEVMNEPAQGTVVAEQHKATEEQAERDAIEACGEIAPEDVTLTRRGSESSGEAISSLAANRAVERVHEEEGEEPASSSATSSRSAPPLGSTAPEVTAEVSGEQVVIGLGDRTWRIRGLEKNHSYGVLRVSVLVARGDGFFADQLELCSARHRQSFLRAASIELGLDELILKSDLGKVFWKLERLQDEQIKKSLEVKPEPRAMSEVERAEAERFLKDPRLVERVLEDFEKCGVVGEETNKLVGYLAAISRKLEEPLGVVIQSSSASGKSSLMDAVMGFVPEEEKVSYSAMTGQSLFYMGATDLQHKVLAIAEEEGATHASYALKILQSAGELTIASTGKDPQTGRLVTQEYRVTGPVMVMLTTTSIEIDEELLNRCLVLTVDEGAAQTKAIQDLQRASRTLLGRRRKHQRGRIMSVHQNAQRLLRPVTVVNELAPRLAFASHAARMRRDNKKYLTLIDTIAFLHQHQRPVKTDSESGMRYIEVTEGDIELANRLCAKVLASTVDELAPQTRGLHALVDALVVERAKREGVERSAVRFTRRDVRDFTRWGDTQLKVHLKRLEELEYLVVQAGGARRRMVYELAVKVEGSEYDANWSGEGSHWSGSGRGLVGSVKSPDLAGDSGQKRELVGGSVPAQRPQRGPGTSYAQARRTRVQADELSSTPNAAE